MAVLSKSKNVQQRLWRPDFRAVHTLPDTKVIRTGFLLNFIALALAALGISLYGVREYQLQGLVRSVDVLEQQVSESTAKNRIILDSNKRFRQSAEVVQEAIAFDFQPFPYHSFIADLARILPEGLELVSLEMKSTSEKSGSKGELAPFVVELTGKVLEDAPASPSQVLKKFQEAIGDMPSMAGKKPQMEMSRFGRNNESGDFDFTLLVKIPLEKPPSL
jgi:hypothetical protein